MEHSLRGFTSLLPSRTNSLLAKRRPEPEAGIHCAVWKSHFCASSSALRANVAPLDRLRWLWAARLLCWRKKLELHEDEDRGSNRDDCDDHHKKLNGIFLDPIHVDLSCPGLPGFGRFFSGSAKSSASISIRGLDPSFRKRILGSWWLCREPLREELGFSTGAAWSYDRCGEFTRSF